MRKVIDTNRGIDVDIYSRILLRIWGIAGIFRGERNGCCSNNEKNYIVLAAAPTLEMSTKKETEVSFV
jgi:hypothetical protein